MRQPGWSYPDGTEGPGEYRFGGLRAVAMGGRTLLAGMYCDADGGNRVDLRDAATGAMLDVDGYYKEWWNEPALHFTSFSRGGRPYVVYVRPRYGYSVREVTPQGFELSVPRPSENEVVSSLAPAEVDGHPALLVCGPDDAVFRDWHDADRILRTWTVPAGWSGPMLVASGGRCYAWLDSGGPSAAGPEEVPEYASQLWDVTADAPAGPPLLLRGFQFGPWDLAGRPVMLFKVDWQDYQLWDVARQQPLGPGLGDLDLANPCTGLVHGRPALAASLGTALRAWDVGTGAVIGAADLPDVPIATTMGPDETVWAITRTGFVGSLICSTTD